MIIEARRKGEEPPKLNLNLPPKFIEVFFFLFKEF